MLSALILRNCDARSLTLQLDGQFVQLLKNYLLCENGRYFANCHHKSNIFNECFPDQCSINDDDSVPPEFIPKTKNSFFQTIITKNQRISIIRKFNPNLSHGCNEISVFMVKLCVDEVAQ